MSEEADVAIVGAGFTGLSVAYELAKNGISVTVLESDPHVGGLAAAFDVGGRKLDRFYHHWFTNDLDALQLTEELGLSDQVETGPTNTGIYYANNIFKLSDPIDLLKFTALPVTDRLRLGLMLLRARSVRDWLPLESMLAHEWLRNLGGNNVYRVVWEPLLDGKFGPYAKQISAVWFWNKLKLRGGSRGKVGEERLAYLRGGFASLADALAREITRRGGHVSLNTKVALIEHNEDRWVARASNGTYKAKYIVATPALPLTASLIRPWADPEYLKCLESIEYMGNLCLILELDRPLSKTYWLNVSDPGFPFVGVIEHTNFQHPGNYGGKHIVYLSKYLAHTDMRYDMNPDQYLDYAFPFLKSMFPALRREWILAHHLWRARWAQPVVGKHYSKSIPSAEGPKKGLYICSMAQIYPEDRGTNYAIREGRKLGAHLANMIHDS